MDVKMVVFLAVGITLVISFLLLIIMITILMYRKRRIARRKFNTRGPEFDSDDDENVPNLTEWQRYKELKQSDAKVRQRYKESKQSAEMQDLLPIPKTQPSTVIELDDRKPMTEQASTLHQCSHISNLMKEKGPDPGHCAFCGQENSAMFVLPCEHLGRFYMPTCMKCGISRGPCEKCMASKRKSIEFAAWTVLTDSARN